MTTCLEQILTDYRATRDAVNRTNEAEITRFAGAIEMFLDCPIQERPADLVPAGVSIALLQTSLVALENLRPAWGERTEALMVLLAMGRYRLYEALGETFLTASEVGAMLDEHGDHRRRMNAVANVMAQKTPPLSEIRKPKGRQVFLQREVESYLEKRNK